nr:hypothetical protein [uncultured Romboutsia sp.]
MFCCDDKRKKQQECCCKGLVIGGILAVASIVVVKICKKIQCRKIEKIIEELEIDTTTSLGKNKINIVRLFSENKINFEFFMYRGYNFESIDAQVYVDSSKDMVRAINELIEVMSIKPKFIDYMGEMAVIKFIPNERFYFRRWVDYLLLLISFIEYLESISIEGIHLEFDFSPFENEEFIKVNNDLEVRENVKFTKDLFSYTDR